MVDPLERPQSVFALQKALKTEVALPKDNDIVEKIRRRVRDLFGTRQARHATASNITTIQEDTR
jgi:hypothetical protein